MCVIVDTCVAHRFFTERPPPDCKPVLDWLSCRGGGLVYRAARDSELLQSAKARSFIAELGRQGRAFGYRDDELFDHLANLRSIRGGLRSDDAHTLALARASGARVLCTDDDNLIADFKDKRVLNNPRGSVYSKAEHVHLLKHNGLCIGG